MLYVFIIFGFSFYGIVLYNINATIFLLLARLDKKKTGAKFMGGYNVLSCFFVFFYKNISLPTWSNRCLVI